MFHILAITNNATTNILVYVAFKISVFIFFLSKYTEVGLLDYMVVLFLIFKRTFILFSQWLTNLHSYQCYSVEKRIPLSPDPHQHLLFVLFDGSHSDTEGMKLYLIVVSICLYLIMRDTDHLFMCMLATCRFSLQKCLFSSSAQLKFFFFDCAMCLMGSQFPDQGLNLGHSSKNPESQPLLLLLLLSCFSRVQLCVTL